MSATGTRCILCGSTQTRFFREVVRDSGVPHAPVRLELARCRCCAFVFLANPPSVDYDAGYLEEQEVLSTGSAHERFRLTERIAEIARAVPPGPGVRLLDIGIGDGTFLHASERAGYSAAGLDINVEGVALAKQKYALKAQICVEPLASAFVGCHFDVIHLNEVIEHVLEPLEMLRWCRDRIAPGGILVVQTGNIDSIASRVMGGAWDYIRPYHVGYYSPRSMRWALHEACFSVERMRVVDWRVRDMLGALRDVSAEVGLPRALRWLAFAVSCKLPGVRRTLLVRARPL